MIYKTKVYFKFPFNSKIVSNKLLIICFYIKRYLNRNKTVVVQVESHFREYLDVILQL